jgi:hypothetical protein
MPDDHDIEITARVREVRRGRLGGNDAGSAGGVPSASAPLPRARERAISGMTENGSDDCDNEDEDQVGSDEEAEPFRPVFDSPFHSCPEIALSGRIAFEATTKLSPIEKGWNQHEEASAEQGGSDPPTQCEANEHVHGKHRRPEHQSQRDSSLDRGHLD